MTPSAERAAGATWILSFLTGAAAAARAEQLPVRGAAHGRPAPRAGLRERPGWEGERLWLEGAEGSAFLYEPLNFRQTGPLPHGGGRQAGVLLALEGLWPSSPRSPPPPTDTHRQCPAEGRSTDGEGEARALAARSGGSEKRKIFIK